MGQITSTSNLSSKKEEINKNRFEFLNIIGRGGFGKVWKVIDKRNKTQFALKEMQKPKIIDKKSVKSVKYERELLSKLYHPFIVNMHYAFQDHDNLYLVIDLLTGGDLRYHISKKKRFTEEQTKFFIACIIIALEYIHSNNIIHRDIKPENLVIDDKGYLLITDFGIAKEFSINNFHETSGTPGYMGPEVLKAQNHSFPVDYYAIGVIGYEFMLGKRPYSGKTRKDIKDQMLMKQAYIKEEEIPPGWKNESVDFINKLLQRKQEMRLGFKGIQEIKKHSWFKSYPWKYLLHQRILSPFVPEKQDNFDKKYCEAVEKLGLETRARYEKYKMNTNYNDIFRNYTYIAEKKETNHISPHNKSISQNYQRAVLFQNKQISHKSPFGKNHSFNGISNNKHIDNIDNNMIDNQLKRIKNTEGIQTKTPIPFSHNRLFIRSMSNMCISPYMMHNKKNPTIANESSLCLMNNKEIIKEGKNNILNKELLTKVLNQCNQKPRDIQVHNNTLNPLSNQTKQINLNKTILLNKTNNSLQPNLCNNEKDKHNLQSSILGIQFKNVKSNGCSLNSTGGSMSSKFLYNVKDKG